MITNYPNGQQKVLDAFSHFKNNPRKSQKYSCVAYTNIMLEVEVTMQCLADRGYFENSSLLEVGYVLQDLLSVAKTSFIEGQSRAKSQMIDTIKNSQF